MAIKLTQIITNNQDLNRVQANITKALSPTSSPGVTTLSTTTYALKDSDAFLAIPTSQIAGGASGITITLLDATRYPGFSFAFKKTDTSSNPIKFVASAKNRQGSMQTIENGSSYSTSSSLASGFLYSDGNNWWLV